MEHTDRTPEASAPLTEEQILLTGGRDDWHLHPLPSQGLPAIMVTDGPHGLRKQSGDSGAVGLNASEPATCFPPAVALATTWSREAVRAVAQALGEEAHAQGVAVVLGPGMNIKRSPLCGRNFEYFSEDPHLTGEIATAFVQSLQAQGIGACVKHFAANNQESDRLRISAEIDDRTLHEIYLRAFRSVVEQAQPWAVMCAYNAVNGVTAAEHHQLLTEELRDAWGFQGVVVSDWGAVLDRPASLRAGLDLAMPANRDGEHDLRTAVAEGSIDPAVVAHAAGRVQKLVRRCVEQQAAPDGTGSGSFDTEAHHQVALEAARRAIVLLRNDGALPLDADADVAVIGHFAAHPRYQGTGSSHVTPTRLDTALDAIREIAGREVPYAQGFVPGGASEVAGAEDPGVDASGGVAGSGGSGTTDAARLRAEAVDLAAGVDTVVLFLGLGEDAEGEGWDRETTDLPVEQLELLEAVAAVNPRIVLVLSHGSAVTLPATAYRAPAVLDAWLLGQAGGTATAEVLYGLVNPSGKLSETIPHRLEDVPSYLHFPGDTRQVHYGEGIFVGYRGFDARRCEVAFPFGHGLSYTEFELHDLDVTAGDDGALSIEITAENTGVREGRTVVQIYAGLPGSRVPRPIRELVAFEEVTLAPGERQRLHIPVRKQALQYWDTVARAWRVEPGAYRICAGFSSRDLRALADVEVAGDAAAVTVDGRWSLREVCALSAAAPIMAPVVERIPEDMRQMLQQITLDRLVHDRAALAELLDAINHALREERPGN